jgi:FAD:protein FMN transferase
MKTSDTGRPLPSRRDFIALGIGALVVASLPRSLRRSRTIRRTLPVMGTIAEFAVVHPEPRWANGAIDAAMQELLTVERTMSRFRSDSDIGRANARAAAGAVAISAPTALVVREALRWAHSSDGLFDPCLGRAVALWDVQHRHVPPAFAQFHRFAGRRLYRGLTLDRRAGGDVVVFDDRDIAIDLGGIAKGYGVDRATAALRAWGITRAIVNVGGDLYALGHAADGEPWRIGIQSPFDPDGIIAEIPAADQAVATSGDYVRYFQYHGRRFSHLLDPRTGEPWQSRMHSITVSADTCMAADVAATAAFGSPPAAIHRILARSDGGTRLVHLA